MSKRTPLNDRQLTFVRDQEVTFDAVAFDEAIRAHGVTLVHWMSMRCPIGRIDPTDIRRPHEHHENCSNGFIYTKVGEFTCLFTSNSHRVNDNDVGLMNASTVNVTFPSTYDMVTCDDGVSDKQVLIVPFDRLYLAEESIVVATWQSVEHHITGKDRLKFPAVTVQGLIDNRGIRYTVGQDFTVQNGQIVWGQNRPGLDPETQKGRVYSIRYTYRPFFYLREMIHEIRVTQTNNPITGEREVTRMPQSAILNREYIYHNEENDSAAAESARQQLGPSNGSFGPR